MTDGLTVKLPEGGVSPGQTQHVDTAALLLRCTHLNSKNAAFGLFNSRRVSPPSITMPQHRLDNIG